MQANDTGDLFDAPGATASRNGDDEVHGFGDEGARHSDSRFEDQLLKAAKSALGRARVNRGDAAGMAGAPGFEQGERLATTDFTDDDAVGTQAQGGAKQGGEARHPGVTAQLHV